MEYYEDLQKGDIRLMTKGDFKGETIKIAEKYSPRTIEILIRQDGKWVSFCTSTWEEVRTLSIPANLEDA